IEYEVYCFEAVVSEPLPLSVLSQLNADGSRLELKLEGAELYNVEVNGLITQVTTDNYSIALKEGNNVIKVFTNKSCQGVYEEEIFVPGPDLVYPNPFFNHTAIYVGRTQERTHLSIFNANGSLLKQGYYPVYEGEVDIDLSGWPAGIYLVRVDDQPKPRTYKIVKR
ncbi:T9SS type A sorting domain-containing protein, partial [Zeaxanthinibacter enoshimensis]|uniref:T9SS type A sorting domain-containing protein n=1 Tax=Zeaxanthinibacter enoshimensis TaxID=392009 RepID=UPI00356A637B